MGIEERSAAEAGAATVSGLEQVRKSCKSQGSQIFAAQIAKF